MSSDPLRRLRDEADDAAENTLEREGSAYDAYERMAGRAQALLDESGGTVPVDSLRELAETWRDVQEKREQNPDANPVRAQVLGRCAGELEELLSEFEDGGRDE